MNQPAPSARKISLIDPKEFGKKAELRDRLKAILKDVPKLHERLVVATAQYEKAVKDVMATNDEFKEATERAKAIVDQWEKLSEEESP